METTFAFLCDYANQTAGKLTAFGIGIDTIYARQVPATHPFMYGVLGLRFSIVEVGPKKIGVRIIDADGNNVVPPLDTGTNVDNPPPGYNYRNVRIALGLHGLVFAHYGDYSVSFLVEGQEAARIPFKVAEPPSLPATA
ncbi:MAG: hypothetical protein EXR54_03025 [Dehalococcoidia bacterium]|nr:hypothetical protein [Dehalococcoidia bacterium]MSQ16529.1 hypothetical protein [Dehalococcoidia bacterium]